MYEKYRDLIKKRDKVIKSEERKTVIKFQKIKIEIEKFEEIEIYFRKLN